ncbi:MAG: hypothetical protein QOG44_1633 [Acidimicrobiaceae bacterium]|nr:hypothetical protein [Acidimicrobiaceae bacterium]
MTRTAAGPTGAAGTAARPGTWATAGSGTWAAAACAGIGLRVWRLGTAAEAGRLVAGRPGRPLASGGGTAGATLGAAGGSAGGNRSAGPGASVDARPILAGRPGSSRTAVGSLGSRRSRPVGVFPTLSGAAAARGSGTVARRTTVSPGASGAVVTVAQGSGQAGCDVGGRRPGGADDLDASRFGFLLFWWQYGHDGDAVHLELGVHPQHVARLGALAEEGAVEYAAGLQGTGGPPGPASIGPRASQLDLDPAGHGA